MILRKIILILVISLLSVNSQARNFSYPYLDEVIYNFFRTYQPVNDLSKGEELKFMKTPKGWEVGVSFYDPTSKKPEIKNVQTYWSADERKYLEMDYSPKVEKEDEFINYYTAYKYFLSTKPYQRQNFAIHTFYGYDDFEKDIIELLEGERKLNDTMLYSLGDAYINPVFVYSKITEEKDQSYLIENGLKGLAYKKHIIKNNPDFLTVVGDIQTKCGNDLTGLNYNSKVFLEHLPQKDFLHEGAYSLWMLEFAKNYLSHCPKDAILFTGADNDTYPLLYVQEYLGFRKDVTVLNTSLLNTIELIEFIRKPEHNINVSLTKEAYSADENKMLVLEPTAESYSLIEWLQKINDGSVSKTSLGDDQEYSLGQRGVFLEINGKKIEWKINKARIVQGELAMLDIIASNASDRPICFTATQSYSSYLGLGNYLRREGMVHILGTEKSEKLLSLNVEVMEENLLNNSFWDDNINMDNTVRTNYYYAFYLLVNEYLTLDKKEEAKRVLLQCLQKVPFNSKQVNSVLIYMVDLYAKMDEEELAVDLLEIIIQQSSIQLKSLESVDLNYANFRFIDGVNNYWNTMNTLLKITDNHTFLDENTAVKSIESYEPRVKTLLEEAIKAQAYMKMLIGEKELLLDLVKK